MALYRIPAYTGTPAMTQEAYNLQQYAKEDKTFLSDSEAQFLALQGRRSAANSGR